MASRRQERIKRVIRESVSDTIANHLSDPRITGVISVTSVDVSPNLRTADVSISIMSASDADRRKTFRAIEHATKHIRSRLGRCMTSKYCPELHFSQDAKLKKTLETLRVIEEAASEYRHEEDPPETDEETETDIN